MDGYEWHWVRGWSVATVSLPSLWVRGLCQGQFTKSVGPRGRGWGWGWAVWDIRASFVGFPSSKESVPLLVGWVEFDGRADKFWSTRLSSWGSSWCRIVSSAMDGQDGSCANSIDIVSGKVACVDRATQHNHHVEWTTSLMIGTWRMSPWPQNISFQILLSQCSNLKNIHWTIVRNMNLNKRTR